jgi:hypothetical protein
MPLIYLKSGGYIECDGYTIKEGCARAIGGSFRCVSEIPDSTRQPEIIIPLSNILFITPQPTEAKNLKD